jgi:hypothetical protein
MSRSMCLSVLTALALLASGPAQGNDLQPTLTLGLAAGLRSERLQVRAPPLEVDAIRSRLDLGLEAGLSLNLPWQLGPAALRSQTQGALGLVPASGELLLGVEQQLLSVYRLSPDWSLQLGLSGGLQVGTASGLGLVELGLPLGLRWGAAELLYVPALVFPVGARQEPLLGGQRRLELSPGLVPGRIELRWRLG